VPKRVLIASSEAMINSLLTELLRREGFDVCSVRNGAAAYLELISNGEAFCLAILDGQLPPSSCLAVAAAVRADGCETPILLMSGSFLNMESLADSRIAHLGKPFHVKELQMAIRGLLAGDVIQI
jgi:DNA-binding response OmpR family regulator